MSSYYLFQSIHSKIKSNDIVQCVICKQIISIFSWINSSDELQPKVENEFYNVELISERSVVLMMIEVVGRLEKNLPFVCQKRVQLDNGNFFFSAVKWIDKITGENPIPLNICRINSNKIFSGSGVLSVTAFEELQWFK